MTSPEPQPSGSSASIASRVRSAVEALTRLHAWRAEREQAIADETAAELARIDRVYTNAKQSAEDAFAAALEAAGSAHEQAWASRVAPVQTELDGLAQRRQTEISYIKERGNSDETAIKKWLDDKLWMADSIFETAAPKPGEQFEALRKELAAAGDRLRGLEQAARANLRACRMLALPAGAPPESPGTWGEGDCAARMKDASERAGAQATAITRALIPRAFAALWPVVFLILGAGAGVGLGASRGARLPSILAWWGAGGAAFTLLVLIGLFMLARKEMRRAGTALAAALAEARAAGERWLELAGESRRKAEHHIRDTRDLDHRSAQTKAAAKREELHKARRARLAELEASMKSKLDDLTARRDAAAREVDEARDAAASTARAAHHSAVQDADKSHASVTRSAQQQREVALASLAAQWHRECDQAHALAVAARESAASACTPWADERWALEDRPGGWTPPAIIPPGVALGTLSLDLASLPGGRPIDPSLARPEPAIVTLPLALELPERASLLVRTAAQGRPEAIALLQSAMLRLLTTLPPGKARLTVIDPIGLGQNFAAFMHLGDYEPALVTDRIWTEPRHIEQRLTDLTEHMETVIQKYLRNQFPTIEDYNVHAGEVAEPYRFLVLTDFPTAINEMSAKRLASILDSGPRCGVYALIATDTRQPPPTGITAGDLNKCAVRLTWKPGRHADGSGGAGGGFELDDPVLSRLPLTIEPPPADERFNRLVHMAGRNAKDSSRVQVPFDMIAPRREPEDASPGAGRELWSLSSASSFSVPMGRAGATKLQSITLGKGTAQHALIAGRTGSGKSTLLHAIITNLALWYSPAEVELYLIDFKKGVEFKTYAAHELPHARVIAIESEREFGLSVLRRLDAELKRRGELFRAAEVQDLAGFRAAHPGGGSGGGETMPRALLIVDEFQELFVEDDKLAQESSLLLDRLVRQGRAFGMHAILGSQTLGGAYSLARSTIGQMAVRIALQCSEADSYLILSDDNPAARLLSRPGEAIYNDASGAIEGNNPFQVAWLSEEARDAQLQRVREAQANAQRQGRTPLPPPIIFEGSAPARLDRNHLLASMREGRLTPPPGLIRVWLGEPIAIKEPTAAAFRRQAAANLLIVGQRDESALAMFVAALHSLAAHAPKSGGTGVPPVTGSASLAPRALILDGTPADAPSFGTLERLAATLPISAEIVPYRSVDATIADLARTISQRAADESLDAPPILLFIHGLQRFRSLRRPENEFDFGAAAAEGESPDKAFLRVLREGPNVGVHTVVWADTVATINRTLERSALKEFDQRVLFQMSASDSSALIDAATAGLIGANRALFYAEELGTIEKFRPYAL